MRKLYYMCILLMRLLSMFVLLLNLTACGLKGDLVIPDQTTDQEQSGNTTSQNNTAAK